MFWKKKIQQPIEQVTKPIVVKDDINRFEIKLKEWLQSKDVPSEVGLEVVNLLIDKTEGNNIRELSCKHLIDYARNECDKNKIHFIKELVLYVVSIIGTISDADTLYQLYKATNNTNTDLDTFSLDMGLRSNVHCAIYNQALQLMVYIDIRSWIDNPYLLNHKMTYYNLCIKMLQANNECITIIACNIAQLINTTIENHRIVPKSNINIHHVCGLFYDKLSCHSDILENILDNLILHKLYEDALQFIGIFRKNEQIYSQLPIIAELAKAIHQSNKS
jgi:hypothetical protein